MSERTRRDERRRRPPASDSNDGWWAVDASLILITVMVGAVIFRSLRFDDPRWWANAWVWSVLLPLAAWLGGGLVRQMSRSQAQRTMVVAFLLSVALHLAMVFGAIEWVLLPVLRQEAGGSEATSVSMERAIAVEYLPEELSPAGLQQELDADQEERLEQNLNAAIEESQSAMALQGAQAGGPERLESIDSTSANRSAVAVEVGGAGDSSAGIREPRVRSDQTDRQAQRLEEVERMARLQAIAALDLPQPVVEARQASSRTILDRDEEAREPLSSDTFSIDSGDLPSPSDQLDRLPMQPKATELDRGSLDSKELMNQQAPSPLDPAASSVQIEKSNLDPKSIDIPRLPEDRLVPTDPEGQQKRFDLNRPMRQPTAGGSWESGRVQVQAMDEALERQLVPETIGAERRRQVDRRATSELGLQQLADSTDPFSEASPNRLDPAWKAGPVSEEGSSRNETATGRLNAKGGIGDPKDRRLEVTRRSASGSTPVGAAEGGRSQSATGLGEAERSIDDPSDQLAGAIASRFLQRGRIGGEAEEALRGMGGEKAEGVAEAGSKFADQLAAAKPVPAFQKRRERLSRNARGDLDAAELAIERGLDYLASTQQEDGWWNLERGDPAVKIRSDTAATGLAILAFQGAGYTHLEGKHAGAIRRGLEALRRGQRADGDLYRRMDAASNANAWLYSHAIAALALCEAYGMTQDSELREPAQRAIDFMASTQDRQLGGWRYQPRSGADTSVTGWFLMALQSGRLAGLEVPRTTLDGVTRWVERSQQSEDQPYLYRYNWNAPDTAAQRHGRIATRTMTSVGLLMRLYTGWAPDHPAIEEGAAYLLEEPPDATGEGENRRDTYYWYYGTQVVYQVGGTSWERWSAALREATLASQETTGDEAGSWEPRGPVPDAWGAYGGRLYVTCLNLLSLEVQYRHLPLYTASNP
ncbi:MAG: prenyltransferase/squalene oxidase repeat-containing protein [Pirellulaceae bacterium]